jgi:hypothetical protein
MARTEVCEEADFTESQTSELIEVVLPSDKRANSEVVLSVWTLFDPIRQLALQHSKRIIDQGANQVSLSTTFPAVVHIFVTVSLEHDFTSEEGPISE